MALKGSIVQEQGENYTWIRHFASSAKKRETLSFPVDWTRGKNKDVILNSQPTI